MKYLLAAILLGVPVQITASAMWAESGVVVTLSEGSEYRNMWIRSGAEVTEPEQLTENSWVVPWRHGTIGGVLCDESTCTIFETQWAVPVRYLWIKIILTLVCFFLIARLLALRFHDKGFLWG